VVREGNLIGLREIKVGRGADGLVEVRDGLKAGERVVTRGSLFIDRAARHD
jgi:cobalt-zinc-cadmium efflux system membrane fusion protein